MTLVNNLSLVKSATLSITLYQKYISPYKGFSCAHRSLHGGESCSAYIKRIISEEGLSNIWQKAQKRFDDCYQANLILKSQCGQVPLLRASGDDDCGCCQAIDEETILPCIKNYEHTNPFCCPCCGTKSQKCYAHDCCLFMITDTPKYCHVEE